MSLCEKDNNLEWDEENVSSGISSVEFTVEPVCDALLNQSFLEKNNSLGITTGSLSCRKPHLSLEGELSCGQFDELAAPAAAIRHQLGSGRKPSIKNIYDLPNASSACSGKSVLSLRKRNKFPIFRYGAQTRIWEGFFYKDQYNFLRNLRSYCLNLLSCKSKRKSTESSICVGILLTPARQLITIYQAYRRTMPRSSGSKFIKHFVECFSENIKRLLNSVNTNSVFTPRCDRGTVTFSATVIAIVLLVCRNFNFRRYFQYLRDDARRYIFDLVRPMAQDAAFNQLSVLTSSASIITNVVYTAFEVVKVLKTQSSWLDLTLKLNAFYNSFNFKGDHFFDNIKRFISDIFPTVDDVPNPVHFVSYLFRGLSRKFFESYERVLVHLGVEVDQDMEPHFHPRSDMAPSSFSTRPIGTFLQDMIELSQGDLALLVGKLTAFVSSICLVAGLKGTSHPVINLIGLSDFANDRLTKILTVTAVSGGLTAFFVDIDHTLKLLNNCIDSIFCGDFSRFCGMDNYRQFESLYIFVKINYGTVAPHGLPLVYSDRDGCSSPITLRLPPAVYDSSDPAFVDMINQLEGRVCGSRQPLTWADGNALITTTLHDRVQATLKKGTLRPDLKKKLEDMCASLVFLVQSKAVPLGSTKAAGFSMIITGEAGSGKSTFVNDHLHPLAMERIFTIGRSFDYPDIVNSGVGSGEPIPPDFTSSANFDANFTNMRSNHIHYLCFKKDDPHPGNPDAIAPSKTNINNIVMEIAETDCALFDAAGLTSDNGLGTKGDNFCRAILGIFTDNQPLANLDHFSSHLPAPVRRSIFIDWRVKDSYKNSSGGLDLNNEEVKKVRASGASADIFNTVTVSTYRRMNSASGVFSIGESVTPTVITHTFRHAQEHGTGDYKQTYAPGAVLSMNAVSVNSFLCYIEDVLTSHYESSFHAYKVREMKSLLTPSLSKCSCPGSSSIMDCVCCAAFQEFCPVTGIFRNTCHHCFHSTAARRGSVANAINKWKDSSLLVRLNKITRYELSLFRVLLFSSTMRPIMKAIFRRLDLVKIIESHQRGSEWSFAGDGQAFTEGGGFKTLLSNASAIHQIGLDAISDWWLTQFPDSDPLKDVISLFFSFIILTPYTRKPYLEPSDDVASPVLSLISESVFVTGVDVQRGRPLRDVCAASWDENLPQIQPQLCLQGPAQFLSISKLFVVYCFLDMPQMSTLDLRLPIGSDSVLRQNITVFNQEVGFDFKAYDANRLLNPYGFSVQDYMVDFLRHLSPVSRVDGVEAFHVPHHNPLCFGDDPCKQFDMDKFTTTTFMNMGLDFAPLRYVPRADVGEVYEKVAATYHSATEALRIRCETIANRAGELAVPRLFTDTNWESFPSLIGRTSWKCEDCNGFCYRSVSGRTFYHASTCSKACEEWETYAVIHNSFMDTPPVLVRELNFSGWDVPGSMVYKRVPFEYEVRPLIKSTLMSLRDSWRENYFIQLPEAHRQKLMFGASLCGVVGGAAILNKILSLWSDKPDPVPNTFKTRGATDVSSHASSVPYWVRDNGDIAIRDNSNLNTSKGVCSKAHGMNIDQVTTALVGVQDRVKTSRVCKIAAYFEENGEKKCNKINGLLICGKTVITCAHFMRNPQWDENHRMKIVLSVYRTDTSAWVEHTSTISPVQISFGEGNGDFVRIVHNISDIPLKAIGCFYNEIPAGRVRLTGRVFNNSDSGLVFSDQFFSNFSENCMLQGPRCIKYGAEDLNIPPTLRGNPFNGVVSHPGLPGNTGDCGLPVVFTDDRGRFPALGIYVGSFGPDHGPLDTNEELYQIIPESFMIVTNSHLFGATLSYSGISPTFGCPESPFTQKSFTPRMDVVVDHGVSLYKEDDVLISAKDLYAAQVKTHVNVRANRDWSLFQPGAKGSCVNSIDCDLWKFSRSKGGLTVSLPCHDVKQVKGIYPHQSGMKPMLPSMQGPCQWHFVPSLFHLGCVPWFGPEMHELCDEVIVGMVGPGVPSDDSTSVASTCLDIEIAKTMVNAQIPYDIIKKAGKYYMAEVLRSLNRSLKKVDRSHVERCCRANSSDSYYGIYAADGSTIVAGFDNTTSFGSNHKPLSGSKKSDVIVKGDEELFVYDVSKPSWLANEGVAYTFATGRVPEFQYLSCFAKDECYPVTSSRLKSLDLESDDSATFFKHLYGISPDHEFFDIEQGDDVSYRAFFHSFPDFSVKIKSRLVSVLPGGVNLAFRTFFMPLMYLVSECPIQFDMVAGLDMSSGHFEQSTMEILKACWDPDDKIFRCFDADVSAWDKIMPENLTYETLLIMVQLVLEIHKQQGTYNDQIGSYGGALLAWWSEFELLYKGALFRLCGTMPSGFVLTLLMNSFMNILLAYCVIIRHAELSKIPLPDKILDWIIHKGHGDDSQTGVTPKYARCCERAGVPAFNCTHYNKILGSWGIVSTLGNKTTEAILYQPVKELVFLQHTLSYQTIPAWTYAECLEDPARFEDYVLIGSSPQKPATLIKMLAKQNAGASIAPDSLLLAQVRCLLYELLPYGREKTKRFEAAVKAFQCPKWKPDTDFSRLLYDELFNWNVVLSWYVAKFCKDGKMCPKIIKARKDNPEVFTVAQELVAGRSDTSLAYERGIAL